MEEAAEAPSLHRRPLTVAFLPAMSSSHIIPNVQVARLLADHGLQTIIIGTQTYANTIHLVVGPTDDIAIHLIPNIPTTTAAAKREDFHKANEKLKVPVESLLREISPDVLIADDLYLWASEVANELGITRIMFSTCCLLFDCVRLALHGREDLIAARGEKVPVPGLPGNFEFFKSQLPLSLREQQKNSAMLESSRTADLQCYGRIVNSFRHMEGDFEEFYNETVGKKVWFIGPTFLHDTNIKATDKREVAVEDSDEVLEWLDKKPPRSVVYVSFGSLKTITPVQKRELGYGLANSGQHFLWVLKSDDELDWMPEELSKRIEEEGKGLIVKKWVHQVSILNHVAVGGFLTHCGWNSVMESICAGVPMITWPLFADQFSVEKLIVEKMKIGVAVGAKQWAWNEEEKELIAETAIAEKVKFLMSSRGEEAEGIKRRTREVREMAKKAVEKDGSSSKDLVLLVQDLTNLLVSS